MTVVDLYTIQIVMDAAHVTDHGYGPAQTDALMAETAENLNDLLPAGYEVRIRRWDDNEGTDDADSDV